ncbi:cobalamin-5'-phosphate synthase [Singulisphaera sp. GP187]|uniref:adenosylcobinamide-GDP ribazoletransferase n=1 Tax=Singulisphaera sp. GP187 TaxID=1882752 RepID=UPI00092C60E6|nr:adenosylcobinamide-GDP ribazoletransferase [Singulisphaera sp. GP187]SIO66486.1 cobalamin-5'-phosphate synthase [Singulisphaera sp. GP187]
MALREPGTLTPEPPPPPSRSLLTRGVSATKLALAFLTVVPLGGTDDAFNEADLAASRFAYPFVGAAIGLLMAVLSEGLRHAGAPPAVTAFSLIALLAILSGGLHLDGLADTFDGLFLWGGPERRLTVMRDPHIGSHGVSAIALVLLGKYAVLSELNGSERTLAVLGAIAISRTLILVSAGTARYARPQGTGRLVIDATTRRDALGATLAVLAFSVMVAGWTGLIAGVAALILAFSLTRLAANRLGGVTGDILGATVELGELAFLVMFSLSQAFRTPW